MYFPQPQGLHYGGISDSWPPLLLWFNRGSSRHGGGAGELDRLAGELDRWPVENGCISDICFLSFRVVFHGSPWLCEKNYAYIMFFVDIESSADSKLTFWDLLEVSSHQFGEPVAPFLPNSERVTLAGVPATSITGSWHSSNAKKENVWSSKAGIVIVTFNFALTVCKLFILLGIHSRLKQIANVKSV